jgi:hypothetical protein
MFSEDEKVARNLCDRFDTLLGEAEAFLCISRSFDLGSGRLTTIMEDLSISYAGLECLWRDSSRLVGLYASTWNVWRRINELCMIKEKRMLGPWDAASVDDHVVKVRLGRMYDEAMFCSKERELFGVTYDISNFECFSVAC